MIRSRNIVFLLLLTAFLAGCASRSPWPFEQVQRQPEPPPQRQQQGQATPLPKRQQPQIIQPTRPNRPVPANAPRRPADVSSPAVMALLGTADQQLRNGQLQRAAAVLQRALSIDPRNPFIYQRLAAVRLAQQQFGQVEALAYKSNSLAVNNPFIQADNWNLIAEARRASGNLSGQRRALNHVERLRLHNAALQ